MIFRKKILFLSAPFPVEIFVIFVKVSYPLPVESSNEPREAKLKVTLVRLNVESNVKDRIKG